MAGRFLYCLATIGNVGPTSVELRDAEKSNLPGCEAPFRNRYYFAVCKWLPGRRLGTGNNAFLDGVAVRDSEFSQGFGWSRKIQFKILFGTDRPKIYIYVQDGQL
jgi:hypothetical protein